MRKKVLSLIVFTGILLVGCNDNNAGTNIIETPMEDVREGVNEGANFNGNNNGEMNNGENQGGNDMNGDNTNKDGTTNTQVEIIEDLNRKNNVH